MVNTHQWRARILTQVEPLANLSVVAKILGPFIDCTSNQVRKVLLYYVSAALDAENVLTSISPWLPIGYRLFRTHEDWCRW
jgi:hypothetical protein